ncbi:MAG: hypothetical protein IPO91_29265 [Chloroflexi bacterium]|nr:hypothetical protein [Chloroflexota bacterium]
MSTPARHSAAAARRIVRRIVIEGTLVLQTPAHFGGGESDGTTVLLLEDTVTRRPLLPGASLAGALRHYLLRREFGFRTAEPVDSLAVKLFGTAYDADRGHQSRISIDDALVTQTGNLVDSRDGVKIDSSFRTADEGALYTFNVWAAGTRFPLRVELCLYGPDPEDRTSQGDSANELLSALATALHALGTGEIPLGARKHRGYGRASVNDWRIRDYRLDTVDGLIEWLKTRADDSHSESHYSSSIFQVLNATPLTKDARHYVRLEATFGLEDSLLIRAGSDVADMAHLMSKDEQGNPVPVLSGTSLAGALRARALKIANTLNLRGAGELIDDLFGQFGGEDGDSSGQRTASRMIVEEHAIRHASTQQVQNRVRIDRFTGGAFDTGLFGQQPVFATRATEVPVHVELHYPASATQGDQGRLDAQVGLLLLLLKDLWTGDLPLGGESSVGRGRLYGRNVKLILKTPGHAKTIEFADSPRNLSAQDRAILENYTEALRQQPRKEKAQ